jgi:hypothetical protein
MSRTMLRAFATLLPSTALALAILALPDAPAKAQGYDQYGGMGGMGGGGMGRRGGPDWNDDKKNGPGGWDDKDKKDDRKGPEDFSKGRGKDRSNDGAKASGDGSRRGRTPGEKFGKGPRDDDSKPDRGRKFDTPSRVGSKGRDSDREERGSRWGKVKPGDFGKEGGRFSRPGRDTDKDGSKNLTPKPGDTAGDPKRPWPGKPPRENDGDTAGAPGNPFPGRPWPGKPPRENDGDTAGTPGNPMPGRPWPGKPPRENDGDTAGTPANPFPGRPWPGKPPRENDGDTAGTPANPFPGRPWPGKPPRENDGDTAGAPGSPFPGRPWPGKQPRENGGDTAGHPGNPFPGGGWPGRPPRDNGDTAGAPDKPFPGRPWQGRPPRDGEIGTGGIPGNPWAGRPWPSRPPRDGEIGIGGTPGNPWPGRPWTGRPPREIDTGAAGGIYCGPMGCGNVPFPQWPVRNPQQPVGGVVGQIPCVPIDGRGSGCIPIDGLPITGVDLPANWPIPPVIVVGPGGPMMTPPDFGDNDRSDRFSRFGSAGFNGPLTPDALFERAGPNGGRGPSEIVERIPPRARFRPTAAPLPPRRNVAPRQRFRQRELLVTVQGAQPDTVAGQLARNFNLVMRESRGFALLADRRVYRFSIPDGRGIEAIRASVANVPGVTQASPNFYHYLQGEMGGDAGWLQYALPKLRIPDTMELASGRGVTVAVIDSGVDIKHPALQKANIAFFDTVENGDKDPDPHGTAIAGIIAGKGDVQGIAPGVKILAIRAFAREELGAAPTTTTLAMARAMDIAVARGAKIVNMSFAGAEDPLLSSLIDAAYAKGVICIAAAGNEGPEAPPAYPAAHPKVIGITATDEKDGLYDMANRGNYVSVAAPGVDILVPVTGEALDYMSGTSFAAAHITGIVALLLERNPKLKPDQVREILLEAAHDLGRPGQDDEFGAGLADAYGAVSIAQSALKVQSSSFNR